MTDISLGCTRISPSTFEVELVDGLHFRIRLPYEAARTLLNVIDKTLKTPSANECVHHEGIRFDTWNDGNNRYGIRFDDGISSVTARVEATALDSFADQLETALE